jgi:hypothetical protein
MAVFNEVLNISINVGEFATEMKKVEQIYANSLRNMPNLADMGQVAAASSFSQAAKQISEAAVSIESHVAEMASDVERAMERVGTSARVAGPKVAEGLAPIKAATKGVEVSVENMERGFITAMNRIPGRMAVIFALGAAMKVIESPFKFLEEGFKQLAESSIEFKEVNGSLQDTLSILEQISAKPFFDAILTGMKNLNTWLKENKGSVELFAHSLSDMAASAMSSFGRQAVDAFSPVHAVLMAALDTLSSFTLGIAVASNTLEVLFKLMFQPDKALDSIRNYGKELARLYKDSANARAAEVGAKAPFETGNLEEGIISENQKKNLRELIADHKVAMQTIKENKQKSLDDISVLVAQHVISDSDAEIEKVKATEEAKKKIKEEYAHVAAALPSDKGILMLPKDMASERAELQNLRKETMGGGGPNSPMGSIMSEERTALIKGEKDKDEIRKAAYEKEEKDVADHYQKLIAAAKDNASRHRETYLQAFAEEDAAEQVRHAGQLKAIKDMTAGMPGGVAPKGSKEDIAQIAATEAEERKHADWQDARARKEEDAQAQTLVYAAKIVSEQNKAKTAQDEIGIAQAKLIGDKQTEVVLGQQRLRDIVDEAQAALDLAEAQAAAASKAGGPGAAEAEAVATQKRAVLAIAQETADRGEITLQTTLSNLAHTRAEEVLKIKLATDETVMSDAKSAGSKTEQASANKDILQDELRIAQEALAVADNNRKIAVSQDDIAKRDAERAIALERVNNLTVQLGKASGTGINSEIVANVREQLSMQQAVAQTNVEQAKLTGLKHLELAANKQLMVTKLQELELTRNLAALELSKGQAKLPGETDEKQKERIASLERQLREAQAAVNVGRGSLLNQELTPLGSNAQQLSAQGLQSGVPQGLWDNLKKKIDEFTGIEDLNAKLKAIDVQEFGDAINGIPPTITATQAALERFGAVLDTVANSKLSKDVNKIAGSFTSGFQSGGVAGGLMAAGEEAASMIPVVGPLISDAMKIVTSLFAKSIQNMVNDINAQIQAINQQAQLKQIGIAQQIKELQAEEQSAIQQLGGKKKASDQLKAILKQLDAEIAQLQFQAQQTILQFNNLVSAGSLGNMTGIMSSWAATWEQINQQVEQYVQAGGSMATAAEYMNQQLTIQRQQLQDQMNQGNQTAISDALQLNTLEQQKVQMMKDEAATEFGLLNSDSVERRTANAVKVGTELTKQRAQFAQQITDLNNQISLGQQKVAIEGKVFDINKSIAQLQKDSNALTLASLNEQLLKYQDMAKLLASTSGLNYSPSSINPQWGLGGTQAPIPGEPSVAGPVINGGINVYVSGSVTADNAASLGDEIARSIRSNHAIFGALTH